MNTRITEDYCNFEVAKLLKEKGFDENCHSAWLYNPRKDDSEYFVEYLAKGVKNNTELEQFNEPDTDWAYSAPTLQMAMKWLREVYRIDITVDPHEVCSDWIYQFHLCKDKKYLFSRDISLSYEDCAEAAIKYCLINLI